MSEEKRQHEVMIDEMINEGLGAGKIDDYKDSKRLENPLSKNSKEFNKDKSNKDKSNNSMAHNLEDLKKLGKEMGKMKTEKDLKKKGLTSDPEQQC